MNRKEAIKVLKIADEELGWATYSPFEKEFRERYEKAIQKAIFVLEREDKL